MLLLAFGPFALAGGSAMILAKDDPILPLVGCVH
jgi:hypothetical protein